MTQNTEQKVRTRDEQVISLSVLLTALASGIPTSDDPDAAMKTAERHILEAEARGAAEQRRKDAEFGLQPISLAKKDRTIILAKIHDDLFPRIRPERKDLEPWNGRWVVVSHPGILEDGFDLGWGVAAPVGHGGFPDDWFVGWSPIDAPANVAALEARVKELEASREHLKRLVLDVLQVCHRSKMSPEDVGYAERMIRAALKREGGV